MMIVLVAFPTVPRHGPLLAVLSVGTPVALGTYLAWINPRRPTRVTTIGIAVAAAGALLGGMARLPRNALATVTTIIGAVGANLGLIALDIARIGERAETVRPAIPAVEH
jgi:hypothetical protein